MSSSSGLTPKPCWPTFAGTSTAAMAVRRSRRVTSLAHYGSISTSSSPRHDQPATEGRHPFPTPANFAAAMGSLGIANNTVVVAYDDTGGLTAGRLAVMLRMIGCDAAVLAGGLRRVDRCTRNRTGAHTDTGRVHRHRMAERSSRVGRRGRADHRRRRHRNRLPFARTIPGRSQPDRQARRPHPRLPQRALVRGPQQSWHTPISRRDARVLQRPRHRRPA